MPNSLFACKVPIFDVAQAIQAYILKTSSLEDESYVVTLQDLIDTLQEYGFNDITNNKKTFVLLEFNAFTSNAIRSLPIENMVFVLNQSQKLSPQAISTIKELSTLGYTFALMIDTQELNLVTTHLEILPIIKYLLFNALITSSTNITAILNTTLEYDLHSIVLHVDNEKTYAAYKSVCDYSSGTHFSQELSVSKEGEIDEVYKNTLDLLNALEKEDSIDAIALSFTSYPEITLKLLQHLNSPSFHLQKAIKSIRHAMLLMGKKALKKWLLFIAFSSVDADSEANPLLNLVETRMTLMNYLVDTLQSNDKNSIKEEAPFVAMLSLLHRLIETTKNDMFEHINVDTNIKDAVLKYENTLGKLLALCIAIENFDGSKVNTLLDELGIDRKTFEQSVVENYFTSTE